ncbi:ABC-2 type transport system ATP-binding protein/oleandomycin transport system ATP-binding protein [Rhodococcus sp. SMB37]|uniref:ABC transporter ATP-binding protein n=1 Tax=Rhodococcus sp. SMB37 TaxID=2512213 RepID=UPI0010DD009E|nr:ATP-binding cassette domain-containing protein [Rhodococcus sp. SMB37]TCN54271.1 ABC-2 type transport system ATP-binding protein/oleandomycin transport system ATP-binding protein [Rhodococcus sp. SMB37]
MNVIETEGLTRRYGDRTVVDGLDFRVREGSVHALLGPNGSGKTTTVRMLSTLLRPTSGKARVLGFDTVADAVRVRQRIGSVGQFHSVDPRLTGAENLTMFARLSGMRTRAARRHARDLLERFDLAEAADHRIRSYSGGMRRRLDILAGTVVRPAVLFLDEPTTGLDPRSRNDIFGYILNFVAEGTTVVLTTQYLDEAERLADAITILDGGRTVATGTPAEITAAVGVGLDLVVASADHGRAAELLTGFGAREVGSTAVREDSIRLSFGLDDEPELLPILRALDADGIDVHDIGRRRASLDEAFLALTERATAP